MNNHGPWFHFMKTRIIAALLGCWAAATVTGCGEKLPTTVPVTGQVIWQGKPLTDGTVSFHPQQIAEELPKRTATGRLNQDGSFSLSTFRRDDGAVPGKYHVTIHSYLSEPASSNDDQNPGEYIWRIPQHYGDPANSGLKADVTTNSGAPLEFQFELTE